MLEEPRGWHELEVIALAAREDRDRDLVNFRRREDERRVRRRLFQGLEERVERRHREHVHLVDDVDLAPQLRGLVADTVTELADVVDAVVGRAVDLEVVDRGAGGDGLARRADAARRRRRALLTAERLGQHAGRGGLADAACAAEQKGVVDALLGERVRQRARHVLLPDDVVEGLRPVLACEDEVRHGFPRVLEEWLESRGGRGPKSAKAIVGEIREIRQVGRQLLTDALAAGRLKGGPRHPLCPLPLLPSGPGGVHRRHVTRDHNFVTVVLPFDTGDFRGERGIRTLGTLRYTRFPVVHLRPLGHLSNICQRRGRDSNPRYPCGYA